MARGLPSWAVLLGLGFPPELLGSSPKLLGFPRLLFLGPAPELLGLSFPGLSGLSLLLLSSFPLLLGSWAPGLFGPGVRISQSALLLGLGSSWAIGLFS